MKFIQLTKLEQHIGSLVVNRPEVRNALHWEAMEEFSSAVLSIKTDPDYRVVLLSGTGGAFISGADLGLVGASESRQDGERLSSLMGEALAQMRSLPVITIAAIDGPARGGGAEIAVSCDLRFISADATIGFVQTSLGLIPGWGGAHRLYNLVGYAKALELLATARVVGAEEALGIGLVNGVFPKEGFTTGVLEYARLIAENDWEAIRSLKHMLLGWEAASNERRLQERALFLDLWDRDTRLEKIAALREKRHK